MNKVVDIGSHHGEFSRHILNTSKEAFVIAVEPNPLSIPHLEKLRTEFPQRFNYVSAALTDYDGEITLTSRLINNGQLASTLNLNESFINNGHDLNSEGDQLIVPALSVNKFLADFGLEEIEFLKIDTQGTDLKLLSLFLDNLRVKSCAVEVFGSDLESNHLYLNSKNTLRGMFSLLNNHRDYQVRKIVPAENQNNEFNVFLVNKTFVDSNTLIEKYDIKNSRTFGRFWVTLGVGILKESRNSNFHIIMKFVRGLSHPIQSLKRLKLRLSA